MFVTAHLATVRVEKSRNFAAMGLPETSSYWKRMFRRSRHPWPSTPIRTCSSLGCARSSTSRQNNSCKYLQKTNAHYLLFVLPHGSVYQKAAFLLGQQVQCVEQKYGNRNVVQLFILTSKCEKFNYMYYQLIKDRPKYITYTVT